MNGSMKKIPKRFELGKFVNIVHKLRKQELLSLRKRPMCWLAIGFLLIISMFLVGRSYKEVLYQGNEVQVYLEGKITDKEFKDSIYGGYWQVTLKGVKVLSQEEVSTRKNFQRKENTQDKDFVWKSGNSQEWKSESVLPEFVSLHKRTYGKIEKLEGKYLCQIQVSEDTDLKIGQQILLTGKYTPWEESTNPGQFDAGKYYCSQGILGQFRKCKVIKQGASYSGFREGMWKLRQESNSFLKQELGEDDGALISAMLLGEKEGLDEEDKNLYQRNGISHILAISGLHLMLLGMGVFHVLKVISGNKRGAVFSIILMSMYCVFTGNSISTIRATIMFALSLTARLLGRSYDSLSALGVAAILQLFINPYVLNNSGFLLSFLAVIGVTFIAPRLQELLGAKRKITKSLCVSISSTIATLPVLLCNYGTYPWYSIFLNLFILPAMSILLFLAVVLVGMSLPVILAGEMIGQGVGAVIYPAVESMEAGSSSWIGSLAGASLALWEDSCLISICRKIVIMGIKIILGYFEICCKIFEHAPFQDGYIGTPEAGQIVFYVILIFLAISGAIRHSVLARKMILLSAICILTMRPEFGTELTMLDVGQGDSIVIRNNNGNVYISDCGSSSVGKVGKYRLLPFLKYKGYGRIKGIFISHLDEDHMNGIIELLEIAQEEKIVISYLFLPESVLWIEEDREIVEELESLAKQNKTRLVYLKQGDRIEDGFMEFLCLHPESAEYQKSLEENRNNQSLVLIMAYKGFEIILTGDVEKAGEKEVVEYIDRMGLQEHSNLWKEERAHKDWELSEDSNRSDSWEKTDKYGLLSRCDVLKVAHHGSSGSSSEIFLETINPKLSLISCGKNNSYGHPHAETVERLEKVGSKIMSTADSGAISININKNSFTIKKYTR